MWLQQTTFWRVAAAVPKLRVPRAAVSWAVKGRRPQATLRRRTQAGPALRQVLQLLRLAALALVLVVAPALAPALAALAPALAALGLALGLAVGPRSSSATCAARAGGTACCSRAGTAACATAARLSL
jgi:hypothetical protein